MTAPLKDDRLADLFSEMQSATEGITYFAITYRRRRWPDSHRDKKCNERGKWIETASWAAVRMRSQGPSASRFVGINEVEKSPFRLSGEGRSPEAIEITGFWRSPEWQKVDFSTFYEFIKFRNLESGLCNAESEP